MIDQEFIPTLKKYIKTEKKKGSDYWFTRRKN